MRFLAIGEDGVLLPRALSFEKGEAPQAFAIRGLRSKEILKREVV